MNKTDVTVIQRAMHDPSRQLAIPRRVTDTILMYWKVSARNSSMLSFFVYLQSVLCL